MLLVICSCTSKKIGGNIQIKAILITLDEAISPNHVKCSDEVHYYDEMKPYECAFKIANYEFDIEDKFILDRTGRIVEFWNYLAEGPLINKRSAFEETAISWEDYLGLDKGHFDIQFLKDRNTFLIDGDRLAVEAIFEAQGLILMQKNHNFHSKGRRIIFEYKEL